MTQSSIVFKDELESGALSLIRISLTAVYVAGSSSSVCVSPRLSRGWHDEACYLDLMRDLYLRRVRQF